MDLHSVLPHCSATIHVSTFTIIVITLSDNLHMVLHTCLEIIPEGSKHISGTFKCVMVI